MNSKNERIKKVFPGIIGLADELYSVYMPTDNYGTFELNHTDLFGHSMKCFSFSTARLCYIAVFRKMFLAAFLILVRAGLVNIDLSDIKNMEVDTYENMICLDRFKEESALMDILIQKVFDAYGYRYETASYKTDDLTDGIYEFDWAEDAYEAMEANCRSAMQENDHIHTEVLNLLFQLYYAEWYGQDDIKIWRFSNRWLPELLSRNHDLTAGSERMIMDNIYRLNYLLYPDDVSRGIQNYSKITGNYEFAAIESAYVSPGQSQYNDYWCRLDTVFLNFGALLTIPYIDALMDDIDLCR
jgi:hypothetical protein